MTMYSANIRHSANDRVTADAVAMHLAPVGIGSRVSGSGLTFGLSLQQGLAILPSAHKAASSGIRAIHPDDRHIEVAAGRSHPSRLGRPAVTRFPARCHDQRSVDSSRFMCALTPVNAEVSLHEPEPAVHRLWGRIRQASCGPYRRASSATSRSTKTACAAFSLRAAVGTSI